MKNLKFKLWLIVGYVLAIPYFLILGTLAALCDASSFLFEQWLKISDPWN